MRPSAVYHTAAQLIDTPAVSKPSRLLSDNPERRLLTSILLNRPPPALNTVVAQRDAILASASQRPSSPIPLAQNAELTIPPTNSWRENSKVKLFMTQKAITSKTVLSFIETNYLPNVAPFERQERIHTALLNLISSSSANNLRTLMQLLMLYWQVGIAGCRPSVYDARQQARALLIKSLDVHMPTEFAGNGEQVGVPDFERFRSFVATFFRYMGVNSTPTDELNVLLLRLEAQSGSLDAVSPKMLVLKDQLDPVTLEVYLSSLRRSRPSLAQLETLKPVLISRNIGPPAVTFLLPLLPVMDVLALLDVVDQSALCGEVYSACQADILARLQSQTSLAVLFGILKRISTHTMVSPQSLAVVMAEAQRLGNESAQAQLKNWG